MDTHEFEVASGRVPAVVDITAEILDFCRGKSDGLLSVFVPHATAGLALIETGSGTEADLLAVLAGLLPGDARWQHHHGSAGHGGNHVLPAFVAPSMVLPVAGGRPLLGTWQSLVLVDPNRDNPVRRVVLSFLAG